MQDTKVETVIDTDNTGYTDQIKQSAPMQDYDKWREKTKIVLIVSHMNVNWRAVFIGFGSHDKENITAAYTVERPKFCVTFWS